MMMIKTKLAIVLALVIILGLLAPADARALPVGFTDQQVVPGVPNPTAIDWLPDGTLLIATQGGVLYRENGGAAQPVLDLSASICAGGETGLLGVAVDPAFAASRFIFLYYTVRRGAGGCDNQANRANRVSRFVVDAGGGISGETVLIDNIPAPGGNHNGGDLQFDSSGLLYVAVGDGGKDLRTGAGQNDNGNARRLGLLNGKILRIDTSGGIPAGNPFQGAGTTQCSAAGLAPSEQSAIKKHKKQKKKDKKNKKKDHGGKHKHKNKHKKKRKRRNDRRGVASQLICQEIYATGLRNPFRIAFDPNDVSGEQRFYINDVGGGAWEEIDVGAPGADYGWNVREGPCPTGVGNLANCSPSGQFTEPLFAYSHATDCRTITGGAFVPSSANWPAQYTGVYLYADFICGNLFALRNETPGQAPEVFATGTSATHLAFGPDGDLYYTTFDGGGQVRRIAAP